MKILALALLAPLVAACTAGPDQTTPSERIGPYQGYQAPPSQTQAPASTNQTPPSTYQQPPSMFQNPGGGGAGCLPCTSYVCSFGMQTFSITLLPDPSGGCRADRAVLYCDGVLVDSSNTPDGGAPTTGSWSLAGSTLTITEGGSTITCTPGVTVSGGGPPTPGSADAG
jgi:hypothetical protein